MIRFRARIVSSLAVAISAMGMPQLVTHPGPASIPAPSTVNPAGAAAGGSTQAVPVQTASLSAYAKRHTRKLFSRSFASTPPWINQHGYLLRSIRRNVARGGNRA